MQFTVRIEGSSPIIMHNGAGIDPQYPGNAEKARIAAKKGGNRTEADNIRLRQLETQVSLWLGENQLPAIPTHAIRSNIEKAARKLKQGPAVREGLIVLETRFEYDEARYGTRLEELVDSTQFTVPVVVNNSRILRTRAKFDTPWACEFLVDYDEALVDREKLEVWLGIGGQRVGLGDWRPEKSGTFGRYEMVSVR
jgi:hypothetical protein